MAQSAVLSHPASPYVQGVTRKVVATATTNTATITTAQVLTGLLDGTPTSAATYTLPTATLLVAAIPDCQDGDSFEFAVNNKSAGSNTITVAAGADGSVDGTVTVAQNVVRKFLVVISSASTPAYVCYGVE